MKNMCSQADSDWLENYQKSFANELKENYHDPRIKGLIQMRCRNWLDLALAVQRSMGAEGVELAKKARYQSAHEVAKEIRENYGADVQGIYRCYRDMLPWHKPIWDVFLGGLPHTMTFRCQCQVGEYWKQRLEKEPEARELCWIFCSWDEEVARLVDPAIKCEITRWLGDGNPFCELVWTTNVSGKSNKNS